MLLRILIVEDCLEDRVTYVRYLSKDCQVTYQFIEAETLKEGLNKYRESIPDLVLIDYLLPDGTGLEFVEQLKIQYETLDCPIIVLTGEGNVQIAVELMKAGVQDYFIKSSIKDNLFREKIKTTIKEFKLSKEIQRYKIERDFLSTISMRIRQSVSLKEVLASTVSEVREFLKAERVIIYQFQPDMSGWIVSESFVPPWTSCLNLQIEDTCFQNNRGGSYQTGKIRAINDVEKAGLSECHLTLLARFEIKANLVVPLIISEQQNNDTRQNELWGLLVVHQCSSPRQWQDLEVEFLRQLSIQLGIAIQQAQLYDQLKQKVAQQTAELIERRQMEAALKKSEEKFRQIAETINEVFWIASSTLDKVLYVNPAYEKIWGKSSQDLYDNPYQWLEAIHLHEQQHVRDLFFSNIISKESEIEYRIIRSNGETRWIHDRRFPVYNLAGEVERIIGIALDITERKRLEDALFQEKEIAQMTLQSIGDCVVTTDSVGRVTYLNPVAERLLELTSAQAQGRYLSEIFYFIDEISRKPVENPLVKVLTNQTVVKLSNQTLLISHNQKEYAIQDSVAPILDRSGILRGAVFVLNDVTEYRALSRQLKHQAERDSLTGLFNRFYLEGKLSQLLAELASDSTQEHILCYLDLDHFKVVNDTCGHAAGDELLRQLSLILQQQVRTSDILARLGGDEFALLLCHCSLENAYQVAKAILHAVQDFQFVSQDKTFRVGVSIGVVAINSTTLNLSTILSRADAACYAAKEAGRNRIHVYYDDDDNLTQMRRQRQWVVEIRQAIQQGRFRLYKQLISPTISHTPDFPSRYEILVRIVSPEGEIIPPMAFIPAAERYGLMPEIDRAVISLLFEYITDSFVCDERPISTIYMINLSGASIGDTHFLDFLVEQLSANAIAPESICFEITETVAISNFSVAVNLIQRLKRLGCQFALDDFGSGMCSFNYLKSLPVDYVKIDGSFVQDILSDPLDFLIVESINKIANLMNIQTIAESVETQEIRKRLQEIGIDYVQGYAIAPVTPLEET
jgi:diguanylate cyclase (GGDEF)-like protein/PAS domain S-box-containing protein